MANKTEHEVEESRVAYVKNEQVLAEMKNSGLLTPFTHYYTPDEDGNLSQLRTEVVYDRLDSNKNLGQSSGIKGAVNINIDLSKYDYIEVVPEIYNVSSTNTAGWSGMYKLDLRTKKPGDEWNVATYSLAYADSAGATSGVNKISWNIVLYYQASSHTFKWLVDFNGTSYNSSANCFVSKIYGYLREPAMIYTGAELHEGNGIKINNGVISTLTGDESQVSLYYNSSGITSGTITLGNITPYKFLVFVSSDNNGYHTINTFSVKSFVSLINNGYLGLYGYDNNYINSQVLGSIENCSYKISGDAYNQKLLQIWGVK